MIGIYVHIPFCVKKCAYCDFYSVSDYTLEKEYFKALKKEIESFPDDKADTVFFGGGTPSSVNAEYIAEIAELLKKKFSIVKNAEITLEANPKTFDKKKLEIYKNCGINRLSMGLQSANSIELERLGRIHSEAEFEASYNLARKCGFSNINIDIMYGLPFETKASLKRTLDTVLRLNPEHISAYALTLNENTPIMKMNYSYPDSDSVYESYKMICKAFCGYNHYEISNFGKIPCRHNLKYWNMDYYAGFGVAASGFYNNIRYTHKRSIKAYIDDCFGLETEEKLTKSDLIFETIMLSLRTESGLNFKYLKDNYNYSIYEKNKDLINRLVKEKIAEFTEDGFKLTEKGFFVSNSVISSLEF